ncbi:MAG: hypothetical protein ACM3ZA_15035 [Bacillota bacterium]
MIRCGGVPPQEAQVIAYTDESMAGTECVDDKDIYGSGLEALAAPGIARTGAVG